MIFFVVELVRMSCAAFDMIDCFNFVDNVYIDDVENLEVINKLDEWSHNENIVIIIIMNDLLNLTEQKTECLNNESFWDVQRFVSVFLNNNEICFEKKIRFCWNQDELNSFDI